MQLGKLSYLGGMLLYSLLSGVCKDTSPRAPLIFLASDWLDPQISREIKKMWIISGSPKKNYNV